MGTKLKNKIFSNMFMMAAIFIVLSACISTVLLYKNAENGIVAGNKTDAEYLKYFIDMYGEESISQIEIQEGRRITIIGALGDVIYDTEFESDEMENHNQRPEVQQALATGEGEAKRVSDTLSEMSYYYAVKLENGDILRVATTSDSVYAAFKAVIPMTVILSVCILTVAMIVSRYLTKKIVRPINMIDMNNPDNVLIYDEMAPFVSRIRHQNEVIKRQVKDLREKKLEFETITENMSEGLIVMGKRGEVISYNNSAIRLLGVKATKVSINNALLFNRSPKFDNAVENAIEGKYGECTLSFEGRICQVMANPVMDGAKVKGAVVLIIDVTEKEKREALRREFSANVSHELKTPLTSISGYAEIMKSGMVKGDDMVKFADIIYTEARRLIDLVGDIIKVSKLDEDNLGIEETEVNLKGLVNDIIKRLQSHADKKNVSLELRTESDMPDEAFSITTAAQIADEVIFNVVDNAIKYNKEEGSVVITLAGTENSISVEIRDTGIGIPKGDVERVFERFYRVDKSHSKEVGGTGLGLSIVKHGVAYMGAGIKLESEEGVGTVVTIDFKKK